ncbi:BSD domain-containing protein 1-like isoform X1 [Argiope bruennichi]|uniref:BSD domain-containing protein 1-like isoform X1 n=1 Tax=Argiope bruennichi TaxID=94029 RepID=UPI0024942AC7|nr:BSD domain-containing protein 1-like isoform X1 [Argiope bruennichi]
MDGANRDEENNNESNGNSWWGSWPGWLQTAKEKSSNALEFMKRDLTEFTQVVQTDAVAAVSSTAAMLKEKLTVDNAEAVADKARQSITSVIGTIADVFAPQKELEDSELMIIKDSEPVTMDWWQSQLYMIRKDPKTFCHEPEGPPEMYENWLESFDPSEHQEEMTEIMITCSEVRDIYDKLVPTSVSHLEFWQRYFYRVHLLRKAEAKRADLMRRAEQISIEDIEWDKDSEMDTKYLGSTRSGQNLLESISTQDNKSVIAGRRIDNSDANQNQAEFSSGMTLESNKSNETIENKETDLKTTKSDNPVEGSDKMDNTVASNVNDITDISSDPPSSDSADGSRLSPIDSLGKDSSTGDEWEKDFDLEINENDLKNLNISSNQDSHKEEEDDWEKWQ